MARSPKISLSLKKRAAQIKVLLMDVDGTMTDGGVALLSQADGSALEKQGQQALASGQLVPATRSFLEACIRFDRAAAASHRP